MAIKPEKAGTYHLQNIEETIDKLLFIAKIHDTGYACLHNLNKTMSLG